MDKYDELERTERRIDEEQAARDAKISADYDKAKQERAARATYGKPYYGISTRYTNGRKPEGFAAWRKANVKRIIEITRPQYATRKQADAAFATLTADEQHMFQVCEMTPLDLW